MTPSDKIKLATTRAMELAIEGVDQERAREELAPVLPEKRLVASVRRRIRGYPDVTQEQRREALKFVYLAARDRRDEADPVGAGSGA